MARAAGGQVLAIMGSGETSPTMVTVHKALVAGLGGQPAGALLLQTPYAFQENCADISARARQYFDRSVGLSFPQTKTDHGYSESQNRRRCSRSGSWWHRHYYSARNSGLRS